MNFKSLSTLDKDYIILNAKINSKFLNGTAFDEDEMNEQITKLAELGQEDAIKLYYTVFVPGDNNVVDSNLITLLGNNPVQLSAKAFYEMFDTDRGLYENNLNTYANLLANIEEMSSQKVGIFKVFEAKEKWRRFAENVFFKYPHINTFKRALDMAEERKKNSLYDYFVYCQLFNEIVTHLPYGCCGIDNKKKLAFQAEFQKIKSKIMLHAELHPLDPAISHMCAEMCYFNLDMNSELELSIAKGMFFELADEKYSSKFLEYKPFGISTMDDELREIFGFDTGKNYGAKLRVGAAKLLAEVLKKEEEDKNKDSKKRKKPSSKSEKPTQFGE